jgi:YbbR domain-containing protein
MKLPSFITDDWPRKLIAVFFALLIWYTVRLQMSEALVVRDVRVTFARGSDLVIGNEDQLPTIDITLRGSRRSLDAVNSNSLKVEHKINPSTSPGTYQARITPAMVRTPPGVRVSEIRPDFLLVDLDRRVMATLPVRCRFSGQLAPGMARKSIVVVPSYIRVSCPSAILNDLREIVTEPIPVDLNTRSTFDTVVKLENPNPKLVTLGESQVTVSVELARSNSERFFEWLPLHIVTSPRREAMPVEILDVQRPNIQAVVEGPQTTVDLLTSASVRAFIDLSEVDQEGVRTLPIHVWINARECRVRDNSVQPASVRVRIGRASGAEPLPPAPSITPAAPIPVIPSTSSTATMP